MKAFIRALIQQSNYIGKVVEGDAQAALLRLRGRKAVAALIELLGDADGQVRQEAASTLGLLGDPQAIDPLLNVLNSSSDEVLRGEAARALGRMRVAAAADALIVVAKIASGPAQSGAVWALGEIGDPNAGPAVLSILNNKSTPEETQCTAARTLGKLRHAPAFDRVVRLLAKEFSLKLRRAAASALGEFGDRRAVGQLIEAAGDRDSTLKEQAAEALGKLRDPAAVKPLIGLANDSWVSQVVIAALGQIGSPEAIPTLIQAIKTRSQEIGRAAIAALGRIPHPDSAATLCSLIGSSVSSEVAAAISSLGKVAVPPLAQMIRGRKRSRRFAAASVLDLFTDRRLVDELLIEYGADHFDVWKRVVGRWADERRETLVPLLNRIVPGAPEHVRVAAAETFGRLKDPRAVEPLIGLLAAPEWPVQAAAAAALATIGEAVKPLCRVIADPTTLPSARLHAARALGRLKDAGGVPTLAAALSERSNPRLVRAAAAAALGGIGVSSADAVQALTAALQDADVRVRTDAAGALTRLAPEAARDDLVAYDRRRQERAGEVVRAGSPNSGR